MSRPKAYYVVLLAALALLLRPDGMSYATDGDVTEHTVKAALVYNFARFTEWPNSVFDDEDQPLRIAVYGDESMGEAFHTLTGKLVAGRRIKIVLVDNPEDVRGCHLLFLARTHRGDWPQILATVADDPVLTVGEMAGFLESGGMMNLHLVNNKVRFQVDLNHVKNTNLHISSRILKLASSVVEDKTEEQ